MRVAQQRDVTAAVPASGRALRRSVRGLQSFAACPVQRTYGECVSVRLCSGAVRETMPVRRGHVAPRTTIIETIIRKFDTHSKLLSFGYLV